MDANVKRSSFILIYIGATFTQCFVPETQTNTYNNQGYWQGALSTAHEGCLLKRSVTAN